MSPEAVWTIALLIVLGATLLTGFPVALCLAGSAILVGAGASLLGAFDLGLFLALPNRIYAAMSNPLLISVPLFVFMGYTLERCAIAEELLENITGLLGYRSGGTAIAVCLVGALLAASTGIVGATVVTLGLLSLPTMLKHGYDPAVAAGTVCAAGTLGQIIPPSIVLILLADQLAGAWQTAQYEAGNFAPDAVSINDLFAGALVPGLILVAAYIGYLALLARRSPARLPRQNSKQVIDSRRLLLALLPPIGLMIAVLGSILLGVASPTEAAAVGAVGVLLLADDRIARKKSVRYWWSARLGLVAGILALILASRFNIRFGESEANNSLLLAAATLLVATLCLAIGLAVTRLFVPDSASKLSLLDEVLRRTVTTTSMIFLILIGASVFALVFRGLGGDDLIRNAIESLPGGLGIAVLVVMAVMFVLGFFLDFLEIIFIVVPIVAPVLLGIEVAPGEYLSPVWLGVMIAVNLQTSFLTPPFGFALFYLGGVAGNQISSATLYRGVMPFVVIQLLVLALLWFYPALVTDLPKRLFN